jgi:uncharacterized protein
MSIETGRFNWIAHNSNAAASAQAFYTEVLPWTVETVPMGGDDYSMIKAGGAGVGGFRPLPEGMKQASWVSYLLVEDVDRSAKAVVAAGGKTLMDAFEIPTVGRMQPIADPQGGTLIIFTPTPGQAQAPRASGAGSLYWDELWCRDPAAAVKFYEQAFGFTHDEMQMPSGTYYLLKHGDVTRGGVLKSPSGELPTHWLPYIEVADLEGTVARAERNRGKSEGEPLTTPGVGRYTFIRDPQGARLGLITPAPRG